MRDLLISPIPKVVGNTQNQGRLILKNYKLLDLLQIYNPN